MSKLESTPVKYALAILATIVALYGRHLLEPAFGNQNPYHTVWLAVVFSAWYCGVGPAIAATAISALGVWYFFLPPVNSFGFQNRAHAYGLVGFCVVSVAIIAFGEASRRGWASRAWLAAIVDSSDDAIVGNNLDGIVSSWNRGAERVFGWSAQEAVGKSILTLIPAELQDEETRILRLLRAGKRVEPLETVRVTKDGRRINVMLTVSPVRNSLGTVVGASKIARDVTDTKKLEVESRRREEELRAVFNQTYSFLVFLRTDGTIVDANRAALEGCGLSPDEVIGRKFWEPWWAASDEEQSKLIASIAHVARGEVIREECYFSLRDGTVRFADRTLTPVRDTGGQVVLIIAGWLDITEHKNLRDDLEGRVLTRTQELELVNVSLRNLSGRLLMAQDHERRRIARELHDGAGQLLAAMSMNIATIAAESERLSAPAARSLAENQSLIEQMGREIRTLSYLLHPPLLDEVGLPSALEWYTDGFAQRSEIVVKLIMEPNFERLSSDLEIAVFRIVQESLTNIHRHSGSKKAEIRLTRAGGQVHLEIQDEGKGISAENQKALQSSAAPGVGVRGMRERVRQLGGTLEVHSNGDGTTVTATLPFSDSAAEISTQGADVLANANSRNAGDSSQVPR